MHFLLIVALRPTDPRHVDAALAEVLYPFGEERTVTPYFDYGAVEPKSLYISNAGGLLPLEGEPTWQQVADAYNTSEGYPEDDEEYLHVDADGRSYVTSTENPCSEWDWWVVGNRWSGHFTVRPEHTRDPRLIRYTSAAQSPERCDGGPRGLLDLHASRDAAVGRAAERYDRWTALVGGLPEVRPLRHFMERHESDRGGYSADQARKEYRSQPGVRKVCEDDLFRERVKTTVDWYRHARDPVLEFAPPREEFLERAADEAVAGHGYAYLDLDGTWHAPDRRNWLDLSSDTEENRATYYRQVSKRIDSLDPAVLLVAVDCHT